MFNVTALAKDIINQVMVYQTMGKPAIIHVHVNPDLEPLIKSEVVKLWNHPRDFKHYRIEVKFLGLPFKATNTSHVLYTTGSADVIIMVHTNDQR